VKRILLLVILFVSSSLIHAEENSSLDSKQKLVLIIGEELLARYKDSLIQNFRNGKIVEIKKTMLQIGLEVDQLDCFNVSDFFGNAENKYKPNRDFNLAEWEHIMLDCPKIFGPVDKSDELKNLIVFYIVKNVIYREAT
jgi:hypothetical protein